MMQSTNKVVQMIKQDQLNAYNRELNSLDDDILELNNSNSPDDIQYSILLKKRREKIIFKISEHERKNTPK